MYVMQSAVKQDCPYLLICERKIFSKLLTGVQMLVFVCSSVSVGCSTPQGSPVIGRNTFLSSPHLCFIIVFICDLFVFREDPLMN